jgi:hypothetical protein
MAAPRVAEPDAVSYVMKKGDTIYTLGDKYFSSKAAYEAVFRYNRISNAYTIPPGTVIEIPRRYLRTKLLEGEILSFRGGATVEEKGVASAPVIGGKVREGMVLQTAADSFLTIGLADQSRITLPSNSRIRITMMRQVLMTGSIDFDFALDQGRAEASVQTLKSKNDRFRLRTPIAVSAVRGTGFRIAYDNNERPSLTEVTEGSVGVSNMAVAAAAPNMVSAGFGAVASASGDISAEQLLPAPPVLNPGRVLKDEIVAIAVSPVAAATGYHVQMAQDAGFIDMVASGRSATPNVTFENIKDGTYFVRAMAIAPSGLEGMSETYSVRRALTVVGGSAAALGPGVYQFKWLGQGAGKRSYRFQLLKDPKDTVALVDEVGLETTALTLTGLAPGTYFWRVSVRQFAAMGPVESWTIPEKIIVSELDK